MRSGRSGKKKTRKQGNDGCSSRFRRSSPGDLLGGSRRHGRFTPLSRGRPRQRRRQRRCHRASSDIIVRSSSRRLGRGGVVRTRCRRQTRGTKRTTHQREKTPSFWSYIPIKDEPLSPKLPRSHRRLGTRPALGAPSSLAPHLLTFLLEPYPSPFLASPPPRQP